MRSKKTSNSQSSKIHFFLILLGLFTALYWLASFFINVYQYAVVGAIYELLWLPMLMSLFALPVLAIVFWAKEKFIFKSVYPLFILLFAALILLLIFFK